MGNVWDAEYVVTPSLAELLIEAQFPQLTPVCVTELGKGFDNTVYSVNEQYVFRFPRRSIAVPLLKTENALLPQLARVLPIPIATPCFFGRPEPGLFPWLFTGYHLLPGRLPGNLPYEQRIRSAAALAIFLRELHSFPVEEALKMGVPFDDLDRLDVNLRKPRLLEFLEKIKAIGLYNEVDKLIQMVLHTSPHHTGAQTFLVHGDLHIRNMILNEDGIISGIIDWGDVHAGHPAVDLSIIYSFLPPEGRERFYYIYGEVTPETKELARFKALYTTAILLLYAHDTGDLHLQKAAAQSMDLLRS
ncbi:phosphotransferase [Fictibacillus fluitans]|uniref:Phosphotransferase n=1 Tax=Fictibacillus fluitans TaxID=3058422 RepID=A0ABT8HV04_9BACL|nr:phosphotransferase [Fictibacillus sp. NE201]MDN4524605.1 phosphotransferase [Fictibacillus sp. NE201]